MINNVEQPVRKVAVIGGGIGGLSTAHQLLKANADERLPNYDITIFELHGDDAEALGGKARSWWQELSEDRRVAGEHGFRFFPGFYKNVTATMAEIPTEKGCVADHLAPVSESSFYATRLTPPTDGHARAVSERVNGWFRRWNAALNVVWFVLVPLLLLSRGSDARLWLGWAGFAAAKTLIRWTSEARSADGVTEQAIPLRQSGMVDQAASPVFLFWNAHRWIRWLSLILVAALWWTEIARPAWAVLLVCALAWTFLQHVMAVGWLWRTLRGQVPYDLTPRASESLWATISVLMLITSCQRRVRDRWDAVSWWDFIGAWRFSERYKVTLATGLTRSFVATKAERMSARTGGLILAQLIYDINPYFERDEAPDRVLDGPTTDVWIAPWIAHLRAQGVKFNVDPLSQNSLKHCLVQRLRLDPETGLISGFEAVTGATTGRPPAVGGPPSTDEAIRNRPDVIFDDQFDHYVLAVSGTAAQRLLGNSTAVIAHDEHAQTRYEHLPQVPFGDDAAIPPLSGIFQLEFGWMNGIVFHLDTDIELPNGHLLCMDSAWALTAIDTRPIWADTRDDPKIGTILSVDVSDWYTPGSAGFPARFCSPQEVIEEVWLQLQQHIPSLAAIDLPPRNQILIDRAVKDLDESIPHSPGLPAAENLPLINAEELLINTPGSWRHRPCATTRIANLHLAADFVRTAVDFASMESADEAARWAARSIVTGDLALAGTLDATMLKTHPPKVLDEPRALEEPHAVSRMLSTFRAIDAVGYRFHLPHPLTPAAIPLSWFTGTEDAVRSWLERRCRRPGLGSRRGDR